MFAPEEILDKVRRVSRLARACDGKPRYDGKGDLTCPDYYPTYRAQVEYYEAICPHAVKGKFPDRLFLHRSPNQTQKEFDYIKNNYKQTTLPVFMDYLSSVQRAFFKSNWSIEYAKDDDKFVTAGQTFEGYVTRDLKSYGSLEGFMKFVVPNLKSLDANGVLAVKPHCLCVVEQAGEDGKTVQVIDGTELFEPLPFYYGCWQNVDYEDGKYFLIELQSRSKVTYGGNDAWKGRVYEFYDDQNIWIATQTGKYEDDVFAVELYFNHRWDRVPAMRLMGVPQVAGERVVYQSPFLYSVDNLDLVLLNSSNLQMSINSCVYPYKIMVGDVCEFEHDKDGKCNDGMLWSKEHQKHYSCPKCDGSGLVSRMSPLGVMLLKPKTRQDDGDSTFSQPPLDYVSPETTTLEFLRKEIHEGERRARAILHLGTTTSEATGAEDSTATGKLIDLKALYAFIQPVSDQLFELYRFCLDAIGFMRYGEDYKPPLLTPPRSFDFRTETDYLTEISVAIKNGLPPFVIHSIVYKYLLALFYTQNEAQSTFRLIVGTDRLLIVSPEDVMLEFTRGLAADWEVVLHDSAVVLINELVAQNPDFFQQELPVQQQQLIDKAKEKIPARPAGEGPINLGGAA